MMRGIGGLSYTFRSTCVELCPKEDTASTSTPGAEVPSEDSAATTPPRSRAPSAFMSGYETPSPRMSPVIFPLQTVEPVDLFPISYPWCDQPNDFLPLPEMLDLSLEANLHNTEMGICGDNFWPPVELLLSYNGGGVYFNSMPEEGGADLVAADLVASRMVDDGCRLMDSGSADLVAMQYESSLALCPAGPYDPSCIDHAAAASNDYAICSAVLETLLEGADSRRRKGGVVDHSDRDKITIVSHLSHIQVSADVPNIAPTQLTQEDATCRSDVKSVAPAVGKQGHTTVMLRNIPKSYTRRMLVTQLTEFRGHFDFMYLPIDFQNNCNMGYCFINFRSVESRAHFAQQFNGTDVCTCLPGQHSNKIAEVTRARINGRENNVRHLLSSPVMRELVTCPEWMPMLFDEYGNEEPFPVVETIFRESSSRGLAPWAKSCPPFQGKRSLKKSKA